MITFIVGTKVIKTFETWDDYVESPWVPPVNSWMHASNSNQWFTMGTGAASYAAKEEDVPNHVKTTLLINL